MDETRLRVKEKAEARGMNLSLLHAAVNRLLDPAKPIAVNTMRRYWYGSKDAKEAGAPIEMIDLDLLDTIAEVLETPLLELINPAAIRAGRRAG